MAQYFEIHPVTPQPRLVRRAVEIMREDGVIAYPTDSSYALGCRIGARAALDRIRRIRRLQEDHNFSLVTRSLSEVSPYVVIENDVFRLLRSATPGPYTFILKATREVPRRMQHPRRKTIGVRIPDAPIARALIEELGEPLISTTLQLPGEETPLNDPQQIREQLENEIDLVIDGGPCGLEPTTVVDLVEGVPRVLRRGKGALEAIGATPQAAPSA